MNILEIPVIGSMKSDKESFYKLLSDEPLRRIAGTDIGHLELNSDVTIYFYFLNQENEDYRYIWDLIIPHAVGCVVVCDLENAEIFEKNVEIIENIKDRYDTNLFICSLPVQGEEPAVLKSEGVMPDDIAEFLFYNPAEKKTVKAILQSIIDSAK